MIGQSIINVSSGGRNRISGIVAAVTLLIFVLVGSTLIEQVPMAALVGLMFMVAIGTFEWASLRMFRNVPHTDFLVDDYRSFGYGHLSLTLPLPC